MERFQPKISTYVKNNVRLIQSFSFYHWRIIELIETGEVDITTINPGIIQELLNVILPSGDLMMHRLIKQKVQQFEKLMIVINRERKEKKSEFKIHLLPNMLQETPISYCIQNSYSKAAEAILNEIGQYEFDDHIKFMTEAFPDLLSICPLAFGNYLDMRILKPSWGISYTEGQLKKPDDETTFGVAPMELNYATPDQLKSLLFE